MSHLTTTPNQITKRQVGRLDFCTLYSWSCLKGIIRTVLGQFGLVCLILWWFRYRMSSCNTLEPTYVDENWQKPGGSESEMDEWVSSKHSHTIIFHCHQTFHLNMFSKHREEVGLFDTPQKSRERNPPFSIEIDFTQYRRGRDYTVSILTENYFDAFIMQVWPL